MTDLRFPEWYYEGPYERVQDPDGDLPRRTVGASISPEVHAAVECSGIRDGERFVAPFRDANTLDDLLGGLLLAEGYPEEWSEEERSFFPTIQGTLAEVTDRIRDKVSRVRGAKEAWLSEALEAVHGASVAYSQHDHERGRTFVREAAELVRGASRASKRARVFHLGTGHDVKKGEQGEE